MHRIPELEDLHHAFLEELLDALAELLELARVRIVQVGEALRREARDLAIDDGGVLGERVADAEFGVADEPDDVAGVCLIHGFALLGEELVRAGKAHALAGARVRDAHVASEFPRADAEEGDAVAVARIHVCLNLEDEAGERTIQRNLRGLRVES